MLGLSVFVGSAKAEEEMPVNLIVAGSLTVDLKIYVLALGQTANTQQM